jgi:hypothetical protein
MADADPDLPLTLADLERVRADLEDSVRHTESMLARTEALLLVTALLSRGRILDVMRIENTIGREGWTHRAAQPPGGSTNAPARPGSV